MNYGFLGEWLNPADCKSAPRLPWFESKRTHHIDLSDPLIKGNLVRKENTTEYVAVHSPRVLVTCYTTKIC